ncbi:MAG: tRNA pseudouridine(38-40) synthase TruA [Candidatus Omnitrophica bacterium CG11_big_fil_rev_8_21_14_0_20_42_13]|uniref:tRNA pseudouridine synthase A n=1 Tax=Candidatus Ghiorseimicrobium undicola TaxID=1974746 RepID=A0A2H0LW47_9BACT|nr:MAG: tRNA pseudouridine(38-40) synthase TruA [Candidatus Omnitrophica bacterium CG11_big_fil_rev_8_21_14_0_20_42_13]
MRNIKFTIEYDGTNYCGWQVQNRPKAEGRRPKTIQETIENVLKKIFQHKLELIASGRTDSGVHAIGQVANFKTGSKIPVLNIQRAVNSLLPQDISIKEARDAPLDFHSRFSAKSKTYRYLILNQPVRCVFLHKRAYFTPFTLNISRMRSAAKLFLGRHDFKAFCASSSSAKNTVRTIKKIIIRKTFNCPPFTMRSPLISIDITADGFLYNMARSIVGTLIEVARGKIEKGVIRVILTSPDRSLIGPTAPANGLYLLNVQY